jgi:hypothetical protein
MRAAPWVTAEHGVDGQAADQVERHPEHRFEPLRVGFGIRRLPADPERLERELALGSEHALAEIGGVGDRGEQANRVTDTRRLSAVDNLRPFGDQNRTVGRSSWPLPHPADRDDAN